MNSFCVLSIALMISLVFGYEQIPSPLTDSQLETKSIQEYPFDDCKDCKCKEIVKKAKNNIVLTPVVKTDTKFDSTYTCDPDSIIKQINYHRIIPDFKVTCNGKLVSKENDFYEVVFADTDCKEKKINLNNYTQIYDYINGDATYFECGTITGGRCSGDQFLGFGTYTAIDQNGCCTDGNSGLIATARSIEIRGKCASICSLQRSVQTFKPLVTN